MHHLVSRSHIQWKISTNIINLSHYKTLSFQAYATHSLKTAYLLSTRYTPIFVFWDNVVDRVPDFISTISFCGDLSNVSSFLNINWAVSTQIIIGNRTKIDKWRFGLLKRKYTDTQYIYCDDENLNFCAQKRPLRPCQDCYKRRVTTNLSIPMEQLDKITTLQPHTESCTDRTEPLKLIVFL